MQKTLTRNQQYYEKLRKEGRLGSRLDPSWDKKKGMHTCCKSMHHWFHLVGCPAITGDLKLKRPMRSKLGEKVKELRSQGKNSGEIAKILSMPLVKINDIISKL
jgi:hypothetical protein